ncbi:MAG TPA: hypothetical protein DGF10_09025 [Acidimicrobiaceae bacterium]|nr:hypothetical protein [Acidimicrobiaceae bacterium]
MSEDEERILNEMEEQLQASDPRLVKEVSETTVYTQPLRSMKWAVAGFISGVALMVATLSTSYLLAFIGFLVMLCSALRLEHNARVVGRTGLRQVSDSGRVTSFRDALEGTTGKVRDRMRERFRRGDDRI